MLNIATLAVLVLASYRGVQLIVWDSITDPLRTRLGEWGADKPESKLRMWLLLGLGCTYCVGVWVAGIALLAYLFATGAPWADGAWLTHGVEWFAVAGGQALLSRWDDSRD